MSRPIYTVTIAFFGTGGDTYALRQVLESFGMRVIMHAIGRPDDFIDILSGRYYLKSDYIILDFHGVDGKIVMPELGEGYYNLNEPRGNISNAEIEKYYHLGDAFIINLGCKLGTTEMASSFINNGCKVYIGARDYIEGSSSLMFAIHYFYEVITNHRSEKEAFEIARSIDDETRLFEWYDK